MCHTEPFAFGRWVVGARLEPAYSMGTFVGFVGLACAIGRAIEISGGNGLRSISKSSFGRATSSVTRNTRCNGGERWHCCPPNYGRFVFIFRHRGNRPTDLVWPRVPVCRRQNDPSLLGFIIPCARCVVCSSPMPSRCPSSVCRLVVQSASAHRQAGKQRAKSSCTMARRRLFRLFQQAREMVTT